MNGTRTKKSQAVDVSGDFYPDKNFDTKNTFLLFCVPLTINLGKECIKYDEALQSRLLSNDPVSMNK